MMDKIRKNLWLKEKSVHYLKTISDDYGLSESEVMNKAIEKYFLILYSPEYKQVAESEYKTLKEELDASKLKIAELEGKLSEKDNLIKAKDVIVNSKDDLIKSLEVQLQYQKALENKSRRWWQFWKS